MLNPDDERRLSELREEIDRIDAQLLDLLNRRAEKALDIGSIKKRNNAPIFVPEREKAVVERLVKVNRGPLSASAVEEFYRGIFHHMKLLEEMRGG